jgi:predicted nucleotidyltransferase
VCTQNEAVVILNEVCNACKTIFGNIKEAYLYGSYARGDYDEESDVDILVTVEMTQKEIAIHHWELACLSSDLSLEHDITVSISVKPAEQFERYNEFYPFYKNVVREGIKYAS